MSPLERYRQELATGRVVPDEAQAAAVARLDALYHAVLERRRETSGWRALGTRLGLLNPPAPPRGLYLWGGVGRGKTWLMDLFHAALPGERNLRLHFHRFMGRVHQDLHAARGVKNPLQRVADGIAAQADLLCFDEFFVSDIGDAMILAGLLERLFERGVTLVATSNLPPARLYEHGLQRRKFLPAIALLETHTEVLNVDGGRDYRLRSLEKAGTYHCPLGPRAEAELSACWARLTGVAPADAEPAKEEPGDAEPADPEPGDAEPGKEEAELEVLGRPLRARRLAADLAWFRFEELCEGPRSAADYVELARLFHTLLLEGVPVLDAERDSAARRFIALVDECYDHGVKLIVSAEAEPRALYRGHDLAFAFERTESRLLEMQTHAYLAREHRP